MKKERLEAWKKSRELEKLKDGKAKSATPEPADKKPLISAPKPFGKCEPSISSSGGVAQHDVATLPAKPVLSMGALGRIGLPLKPGSTPLKRSVAMDDEAEPERKLQKLDLPEINPEVQSGANIGTIGDDMAAEDVDDEEEDVKPDVSVTNGHANGDANGDVVMGEVKPVEEEHEDEDELEAYMRSMNAEVIMVDFNDAKRQGLLGVDNRER